MSLSCGSKTADLRALIPADSLVYLESNDLGAVMNAITERPAFREAAKTVPDFSVLNGVKLAVAVTGFETKEQPVTDENSVLSFQPRFVAVLDTNAWNFQALSFTENKLGEFINQVYGGEVTLETSDKYDGKYFVWTANDGRKAYALVQGSLVFFGNDETAIEKCLAVKSGASDSIAKNPKITNGDRLAFGYVSPDGVAQISNLLGVKYASKASDEPEVQSAIAGILPQLLRNTVADVTWIANSTSEGIEDNWQISMPSDIAHVFNEAMRPSKEIEVEVVRRIDEKTSNASIYNFDNPQIAWRALLLTLQKQIDAASVPILKAIESSVFETYGVGDGERFLATVGPTILTFEPLGGGDKQISASIKNETELIKSLAGPFRPVTAEAGHGLLEIIQSKDGNFSAQIFDGRINLGETESFLANAASRREQEKHRALLDYLLVFKTASVITLTKDNESAGKLVELISEPNSNSSKTESKSLTETRFNKTGMERKTVSDFGFIGWIITQFAKEE